MPRTIIVGDVHGCLDELRKLIELVAPETGDRLCFLGDLVDRGPDSVGVVQEVRRLIERFPGSLMICGNHEETALRLHEKDSTPVHLAGLTDADWAFLKSTPLIARLPEHGVLLVHGGLYPKFFADYPDGLGEVPAKWHRGGGKRMERVRRVLRSRFVNAEGDFVAYGSEKPGDRHWSEFYDGREGFVVYGHEPFDAPRWTDHSVGIDTGCCYGKRLTALVLEAGQRGRAGRTVSVVSDHVVRWCGVREDVDG